MEFKYWNELLESSEAFIVITMCNGKFRAFTKGTYEAIIEKLFKEKLTSQPSGSQGYQSTK